MSTPAAPPPVADDVPVIERAPSTVVTFERPEERLPETVELAAYFVASEALANVAKYAHAATACVRIATADDGDGVVVEVTDDGIGGADPSRGSGLKGLEDRVEALDGTPVVDLKPVL